MLTEDGRHVCIIPFRAAATTRASRRSARARGCGASARGITSGGSAATTGTRNSASSSGCPLRSTRRWSSDAPRSSAPPSPRRSGLASRYSAGAQEVRHASSHAAHARGGPLLTTLLRSRYRGSTPRPTRPSTRSSPPPPPQTPGRGRPLHTPNLHLVGECDPACIVEHASISA